ncbi:MAG: BrnT family toxin [Bacteroidota bacterium]
MQYNFEWDPVKAKVNYRKHKVSFERAAEVFLDPFMLSIFDDEHSQKEDRWITLGKDRNNVPLVVVHTFREIDVDNCSIRIISARRAIKKEAKQYSAR